MSDFKEILTELFVKIERLREERLTAGTVYRVMGVAADTADVTGMLQREVLECVSRDALLDADADIDYQELSEEVLGMESECSARGPVFLCQPSRRQRQVPSQCLPEVYAQSVAGSG